MSSGVSEEGLCSMVVQEKCNGWWEGCFTKKEQAKSYFSLWLLVWFLLFLFLYWKQKLTVTLLFQEVTPQSIPICCE
jgi:hypothetical protein